MNEDTIQLVYNCQDNQELCERYDVWANNYEQELLDKYGYTSPLYAVEMLVKYLSKSARILDAGAGTGLVGQLLKQRGYDNLEGIDLSAIMLEEARKKNVYNALYQEVLGETLGFASDIFDGIICVGTFTYNHAPSSSLDELIRITKPGGYIIFSLRLDFYADSDFQEKITELLESEKWKLVEMGEPFQDLAKSEPDVYAQVWVYQV